MAGDSWWMVTLEEDESIASVALFNRYDGRRERLSNAIITMYSKDNTALARYTFGDVDSNDAYFRIPASSFSVPDGKLVNFSRFNIDWNYQGCFADRTDYTSLTYLASLASVTKDSCSDECSGKNYNIIGLQNGNQCYCGNILTSSKDRRPDINCVKQCTGNSNEFCGGIKYNAVYMKVSSEVVPFIRTP